MKYDRICVMLPTYKRPKRLRTFLRSMIRRAHSMRNICVALCLHKGDNQSAKIAVEMLDPANIAKLRGEGESLWNDVQLYIVWETERRPHLSKFFNLIYANVVACCGPSTCVSMFGDDMRFVSLDWDKHFLDEINEHDGLALVYGDDCFKQHKKLAVHFVTTQKVVNLIGFPFMAPFRADFIDRIWHNVAKAAGWLYYMPHVKIRHEHNTRKSKANWDWVYKRLRKEQGTHRRDNNLKARRQAGMRIANLREKGYAQ